MKHTVSDNHVDFCDIFLLWNRLYLTIMLESCWLVSSTEQTLSDNFVGMFLLWNRLYLTIMLVSVTCFFYGVQ
jgi:hypothetical protein